MEIEVLSGLFGYDVVVRGIYEVRGGEFNGSFGMWIGWLDMSIDIVPERRGT